MYRDSFKMPQQNRKVISIIYIYINLVKKIGI